MSVTFSNCIFPFVHGKVEKASPQREKKKPEIRHLEKQRCSIFWSSLFLRLNCFSVLDFVSVCMLVINSHCLHTPPQMVLCSQFVFLEQELSHDKQDKAVWLLSPQTHQIAWVYSVTALVVSERYLWQTMFRRKYGEEAAVCLRQHFTPVDCQAMPSPFFNLSPNLCSRLICLGTRKLFCLLKSSSRVRCLSRVTQDLSRLSQVMHYKLWEFSSWVYSTERCSASDRQSKKGGFELILAAIS